MAQQENTGQDLPAFTQLTDLASGRLGGLPIYANDEFFAEKENLVKPGRGVFIPDKYTDRGKWMDGWESRRRRVPGHDWCIIRLGLGGRIHGFEIDTNHFLGNHPPFASVDGLWSDQRLTPYDDFAAMKWKELLTRSPLNPGSRNFFAVNPTQGRFNHLRLNIYPDGGVARFRAYGLVDAILPAGVETDLASVASGGMVLACNDMFFGPKDSLIIPGRGTHMGDGWETRRKRVPGHDWVVLRLGCRGTLHRIVVDTAHFKGNFPDRCSLDVLDAPGLSDDQVPSASGWKPLLPESKLEADKIHEFTLGHRSGPVTHVRLNIFPDGGVSRLRIMGIPAT